MADAALADLQATLHDELPITVSLGLRVLRADAEQVTLAAPLDVNRNHAGTAFAGSLNAIATLAGWSWVWGLLRERGLPGRVVIQDSSIRYNRPVRSDFEATCVAPSVTAVSRFLAAFHRSGRGRLTLEVTVADRSGGAVTFTGRYVAERERALPET